MELCPHCGVTDETWLDRTVVLDSEGREVEEETFPMRCSNCGKNVEAPPDYYRGSESP